eukprot:65106-Rhodomonas_salina.1
MIQHWVEKGRTAIWPKGIKEEDHKACSSNRHFLRGLFYDPVMVRIMQGYSPNNIALFYKYPWLNPVSQLYARVLARYKGISQIVDSSFLDEFIETRNLGNLSAGKSKIHIEEVNRRLTVQLEAAEKAFETVKDLCEHLHINSLAHIIADSAGAKGNEGQAWKLANDRLLVSVKQLPVINGDVKPLTMTDIRTAIRIAQLHIESAVETQEVFTLAAAAALKVAAKETADSDDTSNMDQDEEKLKHFIASKQKALSVLQCSNEQQQDRGCGSAFRGGQGGFLGGGSCGRGGGRGGHTRGGRGTGGFPFKGSPCRKCGKSRCGSPTPEDMCFETDISAERAKLDELEAKKKE